MQMNNTLLNSEVYSGYKMEENNVLVYVNDFTKVCRTCLSTKEIQPICALNYNGIPLINFLESCASVQVSF